MTATAFLGVSNTALLAEIFGADTGRAWVTAFTADPKTATPDAWIGKPFGDGGSWMLVPKTNQYFCISTFKTIQTDAGPSLRRRNENFDRVYVLAVDDVGQKMDANRLLNLFGEPSFKILTSPNNQHWGYILDQPDDRGILFNRIVEATINRCSTGGHDPGMRGVTRYVRLPEGINNKSAYQGNVASFPVQCGVIHWQPHNRFGLDDLGYRVGLNPKDPAMNRAGVVSQTGGQKTKADVSRDPIVTTLQELNLIKSQRSDQRFEITCPWVHEHTGDRDDGTAYLARTSTFRCHHGHCVDRNTGDLVAHLRQHYPNSWRTGLSEATGNANLDAKTEFGGVSTPDQAQIDQAEKHAQTVIHIDDHRPKSAPGERDFSSFDPMGELGNLDYDGQWLIKGMIPKTGLMVLYGDPGSAKTFMALDLALRLAAGSTAPCGNRWFGRAVKADGLVLYIAAEGGRNGMLKRIKAWVEQINGGTPVVGFRLSLDTIDLRSRKGNLSPDKIIQHARDVARKLGRPIVAIIQDTLFRALAGGDENAPEDMGALIDNASRIGTALDCLFILVHHTGKDQTRGARGHSSLVAAADVELSLIRNRDAAGVVGTMKLTKLKEGEDGDAWGYQLKTVALGVDSDLETVSSAVVEPIPVTAVQAATGVSQKPLGAFQAAVIEAVSDLSSAGLDACLEAITDWLSQTGLAGHRDRRKTRYHVSRALEQDGVRVRLRLSGSGDRTIYRPAPEPVSELDAGIPDI